jgi:hypothetical protein
LKNQLREKLFLVPGVHGIGVIRSAGCYVLTVHVIDRAAASNWVLAEILARTPGTTRIVVGAAKIFGGAAC